MGPTIKGWGYLVLCAAAVFAFSASAQVRMNAAEPVGRTVEEGLGKSRTLLLEQDGWKVYRARNKNFYSCFAYKLADNTTRTPVVTGSGMALGMMSGAHGFKMWIDDRDLLSKSGVSEFNFSLFGRWTNTHTSAIENKDKIINGPDRYSGVELIDMLAWDGEKHRFEITTSRYSHLIGDSDRFEGVLDMTGIRAAYARLQQCHDARSQ